MRLPRQRASQRRSRTSAVRVNKLSLSRVDERAELLLLLLLTPLARRTMTNCHWHMVALRETLRLEWHSRVLSYEYSSQHSAVIQQWPNPQSLSQGPYEGSLTVMGLNENESIRNYGENLKKFN